LFLPRPGPSFGSKTTAGRARNIVDAEDFRMGSFSLWHWVVVGAIVLLLFGGRGKISSLMGDFAQGIKAFKKGMSEDDKADAEPTKTEPVKTIDHQAAPTTPASQAETRKVV
jgi:sec-independent protein translocase protein TatA